MHKVDGGTRYFPPVNCTRLWAGMPGKRMINDVTVLNRMGCMACRHAVFDFTGIATFRIEQARLRHPRQWQWVLYGSHL